MSSSRLVSAAMSLKRPNNTFSAHNYTSQLQHRITAWTRHYIESYTESQAENFRLEQQFDQLSPAEKQQLEDDRAFLQLMARV